VAERLSRARLRPAAGEVPVLDTPWLSVLADGSQRPVSRVAALSQTAQAALRLGDVSGCLAALARQRAAAADDPVALVWALTASSTCRGVFGYLGQARADLAEARQACHYAAPLLAEPFWQFTEIVCCWLGGNWAAHAAWERVGAPARARAVAAAMRAAGLPAPVTRLTAAASVRAGAPVTLTARERSVVLLVREGHTNQQIARALSISVKTVEAYLTRLYRKTACSSRVELAVAVTERRLQLGGPDE
jgi:DNA-binding CsgD family transcriptional regulator